MARGRTSFDGTLASLPPPARELCVACQRERHAKALRSDGTHRRRSNLKSKTRARSAEAPAETGATVRRSRRAQPSARCAASQHRPLLRRRSPRSRRATTARTPPFAAGKCPDRGRARRVVQHKGPSCCRFYRGRQHRNAAATSLAVAIPAGFRLFISARRTRRTAARPFSGGGGGGGGGQTGAGGGGGTHARFGSVSRGECRPRQCLQSLTSQGRGR